MDGFARGCPIGADQSDVLACGDEPVDVLKKKLVAETFSGGRKLNHAVFIVTGREGSRLPARFSVTIPCILDRILECTLRDKK